MDLWLYSSVLYILCHLHLVVFSCICRLLIRRKAESLKRFVSVILSGPVVLMLRNALIRWTVQSRDITNFKKLKQCPYLLLKGVRPKISPC